MTALQNEKHAKWNFSIICINIFAPVYFKGRRVADQFFY
jgi:hypothetical protein